jgi:transcriptional regulator with XRE-family HTH domain
MHNVPCSHIARQAKSALGPIVFFDAPWNYVAMTSQKTLAKVGGTYLRAWRKHAGLNQEEAAAKIGIDRTGLSRIETGAVGYSRSILERAAEVYGCAPEDLIGKRPLTLDERSSSQVASAIARIIELTVAAIVEVYAIPVGAEERVALAEMIATDFAEHESRIGFDQSSQADRDRLEYSIVRWLLRLSREAEH